MFPPWEVAIFNIWKIAEPTTIKRKNPNKTGPTGNLSPLFYFLILYEILLTVIELGTFPLFSIFFL